MIVKLIILVLLNLKIFKLGSKNKIIKLINFGANLKQWMRSRDPNCMETELGRSDAWDIFKQIVEGL